MLSATQDGLWQLGFKVNRKLIQVLCAPYDDVVVVLPAASLGRKFVRWLVKSARLACQANRPEVPRPESAPGERARRLQRLRSHRP